MIHIGTDWVCIKSKNLGIRYAMANGNYYLYCDNGTVEFCCVVAIESAEGIEFIDSYMSGAINLA